MSQSSPEYPNDAEIKRRLAWPKRLMWAVSTAALLIGIYLSAAEGVPGAFGRSGSVVIGIVLIGYFWLEKVEFYTGVPAAYFDAAGHIIPRSVMSTTVVSLTLLGTLVAAFGDWLVSLVMSKGA